jgi:cell wall-associated NlpC family hydrolase
MGTERFGLRAIVSVTLAGGLLLSGFPLPASASGPPSLIPPTVPYGSGGFGPTTAGPTTAGPTTVGPTTVGPVTVESASWQNATAQGQIAVQFALAQLGKPYVYGAAGPCGYDPATIYHVAISLGGYRAVQVAETGQPVEVMPLWPAGLLPLATRP